METRTNLSLILAGIIAAFFLGFGFTYALPLLDAEVVSVGGETVELTADVQMGMALYDSEGCAFCHTQNIRPVPSDAGLGTVTTAQRIARDRPALLGFQRVGGDLSCVGDRYDDKDRIRSMLLDEHAPGFSYLSAADISALTDYLGHLVCGSTN